MNKQLEYRQLEEVRAVESENEMVIEGTVNNIGEWSKPIGGVFREKILPGVFEGAITRAMKNGDIFFLHQHDNKALPLASCKSNTLELTEDRESNKLKMKATLPNTTFARDVYELVKSGVLREFSFGFNSPKSTWGMGADGLKERSITDFNLSEISIVRIGAYNKTEAYARAYEELAEDEANTDQEVDDKIKSMEYRLKMAKKRVI